MSNAGKRHMHRVAEFGADHGCVVCGEPYAHVHHLMEGRTPGRREDDWLTMPLCWECHEGKDGIHGTRQRWTLRKMRENLALAITLEAVYGKA